MVVWCTHIDCVKAKTSFANQEELNDHIAKGHVTHTHQQQQQQQHIDSTSLQAAAKRLRRSSTVHTAEKKANLTAPMLRRLLKEDPPTDLDLDEPFPAVDIVVNGRILGAKFSVCEPTKGIKAWNGCLLLYAHGFRPEGYPMVVELDTDGSCYQRLLEDGWIIAATSYRRTGVILKDAMDDVINLRCWVARRYGQPHLVLLEGQSMGGAICTLLSEREPLLFDGVLGVGAALMTRKDRQSEEDKQQVLKQWPLIPILFLTNESELGPIQQYVAGVSQHINQPKRGGAEEAEKEEQEAPILPAIWTVSRPGHNWTNQEERHSAIMALVSWLTYGTFITVRTANKTCPTQCPPSDVSFVYEADSKSKGSKQGPALFATGKVTEVSHHGSFATNFTDQDLSTMAVIAPGTSFKVTVNDRTFKVIFDVYPFVKCQKGDMIAFTEPDQGFVVIAIHNVAGQESAADAAGRVKVGDGIRFDRAEKPKPGKVSLAAFGGGMETKFSQSITDEMKFFLKRNGAAPAES